MNCLNCDTLMVFHPMKSGDGIFQCPECKSMRGDAEDRPRFLWITYGEDEWIHNKRDMYGFRFKIMCFEGANRPSHLYFCVVSGREICAAFSKEDAKEIVEDALLKSNHS